MKPRKPIRKVSVRRAAERKLYREVTKPAYMATHPDCEVCLAEEPMSRPSPATDIHHKRGTFGARLNDPAFFAAVCRRHHNMIEREKVAWAYEQGWLVIR